MRAFVIGGLAVVALGMAGAAHGEKAKAPGPAVDCSRAGKRKARAAADTAMKAKDYQAAIAALEPFAQACGGGGDAAETAWLVGDLAVAYQRAGMYVECRRAMEPLVFPKSDVARQDGNDRLLKALQYNLDQCTKAFDAQYAALASAACPLKLDAETAVAVPKALVPKGATAACLALVDGGVNGDEVRCPQLALVWNGKGGKQSRRSLGMPNNDQTFCCGLNQLAVGVKDGKTLVRVSADGWIRECHGGTATSSLDAIYEWSGDALSVVVDASNVLW